jgi:hypothetical protein
MHVGCGARVGGPQSNPYNRTLGLFCGTYLETTQKAKMTSKTPLPW